MTERRGIRAADSEAAAGSKGRRAGQGVNRPALLARSFWRWLLPLALLAPMLGLAYGLGERALVFPEGAALAFGVLVAGNTDWTRSRWRLVLLPTSCALAGTALAHTQLPRSGAVLIAVGIAVATAQAAGGRLGPVVSAAALPVVFGGASWIYPISVAAICAVLAVATRVPGVRPAEVGIQGLRSPPRWPRSGLTLFAAVAAAWIVIAGPVLALPPTVLAPPLLVATLEWSVRGARPPMMAVKRWTLLVLAAAAGSAASALCPPIESGGIAVAAVVAATAIQLSAVAVVLLLLRVTGEDAYPALAIALVPNLVAPTSVWAYPLWIGVGAGVLFTGAWVIASLWRSGLRWWLSSRSGVAASTRSSL